MGVGRLIVCLRAKRFAGRDSAPGLPPHPGGVPALSFSRPPGAGDPNPMSVPAWPRHFRMRRRDCASARNLTVRTKGLAVGYPG